MPVGKLKLVGEDSGIAQPLRDQLRRSSKRYRLGRVAMTAIVVKYDLPACYAARCLLFRSFGSRLICSRLQSSDGLLAIIRHFPLTLGDSIGTVLLRLLATMLAIIRPCSQSSILCSNYLQLTEALSKTANQQIGIDQGNPSSVKKVVLPQS